MHILGFLGRVICLDEYGILFRRAEVYGASKAALTWFADTLRLDWEPNGIAVTVVSPGNVDTPLT
ncbi:SDR family NAD(P)-dependent oxidoreductase, partial [Enterobacter intestinihominis]